MKTHSFQIGEYYRELVTGYIYRIDKLYVEPEWDEEELVVGVTYVHGESIVSEETDYFTIDGLQYDIDCGNDVLCSKLEIALLELKNDDDT